MAVVKGEGVGWIMGSDSSVGDSVASSIGSSVGASVAISQEFASGVGA
jgi:hypothetical protein